MLETKQILNSVEVHYDYITLCFVINNINNLNNKNLSESHEKIFIYVIFVKLVYDK